MAQISLFEEILNPLSIPLKDPLKKRTIDIDPELKFETFLSQQKKTSKRERDVTPEPEAKKITSEKQNEKETDSSPQVKKQNTTSKVDSTSKVIQKEEAKQEKNIFDEDVFVAEGINSEEGLARISSPTEGFLRSSGVIEVPVIDLTLFPVEEDLCADQLGLIQIQEVQTDDQENKIAKKFFSPSTVNLPIEMQIQQNNIMDKEEINETDKLTHSDKPLHLHRVFNNDQDSSGVDIKQIEEKSVTSLTLEEKRILDQFLQIPGISSESTKKKEVFFSVIDATKNQIFVGPNPSLTPILNMNEMMQSQVISPTHKLAEINEILSEHDMENITVQSLTTEESSEKSPSSNQQKEMEFSQSFQQKATQNIVEQTKMLTTNLSNQYAVADFISQLKDQFEKFKNSNDKKLTVHIRDGSKNLTMLFNMHDEKGINVVFRTTDHDWKKILEKHKDLIETELQNIDDNNQLDIRYIGE